MRANPRELLRLAVKQKELIEKLEFDELKNNMLAEDELLKKIDIASCRGTDDFKNYLNARKENENLMKKMMKQTKKELSHLGKIKKQPPIREKARFVDKKG